MPCPYFEPQHIAVNGRNTGGRLPLLDEYNGCCHGSGKAQPILPGFRFSGCNQGDPHSGCTVLPAGQNRRSRRFNVQEKTRVDGSTLEVLILETEKYIPVRSDSVRYSKTDERLEPEVLDGCERAQVLAFCRSYFEHFPHRSTC